MRAAAFCPQPPMLVPELMGEARGDAEPVRAACLAATEALVGSRPPQVVVVGAHQPGGLVAKGAWGTLAGYGVPVEAPSGQRVGPPSLSLALTLGHWLLDTCGWDGARAAVAADPQADAAALQELGGELDQRWPDAAWLVMGDGASIGHPASPGLDDDSAGPFDEAVAGALGAGDAVALADLSRDDAERLGAAGWAAWQVLAGAAGSTRWPAELTYRTNSRGVGYAVALWH